MPKRQGKKQYSFPILKRKVIVSCLKELGINITDNDIKSPHEEKCKVLYAQILEKLMGIDVMSKQIPFNRLDIFQFPQLHESSIISVRLFREMIKFMRTVGVTDFSISDLIAPESPRTVRNLSAIINFARWREQKYQIYQSRKSNLDELEQKLSAITSENKSLAEQFVASRERIAAEAPQAEALEAEINELKALSATFIDELDATKESAHAIKKQIKSLKAMDAEKKTLLNNDIDTIHRLERKIVKSPDRIKKQLKALGAKIQRDTVEVAAKQQRLSDDLHKNTKLEELLEMTGQRLLEMQHIHTLKNEQFFRAEQEMKRLQSVKAAEEKKLRAIKKSHKKIEHELKSKKHQFEGLQQEHKSKAKSASVKQKQIESLQREQSKKNTSIRTQISCLDKEIEATKEEMAALTKDNKDAVQQLLAKYRQLVENVEIYHLEMTQGMESW